MLYASINNDILTPYYFYYLYNNNVYLYDDDLKRFFKSVTYKSIEDFKNKAINVKMVNNAPYDVISAMMYLK